MAGTWPRPPASPPKATPELAVHVLAISRRILPPEPRGGEIPFGPVIEVEAGAAPYAQLATQQRAR
jgi:hypothetical protein